jgi:hypothetical protein
LVLAPLIPGTGFSLKKLHGYGWIVAVRQHEPFGDFSNFIAIAFPLIPQFYLCFP